MFSTIVTDKHTTHTVSQTIAWILLWVFCWLYGWWQVLYSIHTMLRKKEMGIT